MDVVVVYESKTGTTRRAALAMGDELFARDVRCTTFPTSGVDTAAASAADLLVVGTWTDGLFAVGQRPGGRKRLARMLDTLAGPDGKGLTGKTCAVYCTYAVTPGGTLRTLEQMVAAAGGEVVAGLAIRRDNIEEGAQRLVGAIADLSSV
jgi:flavodoxin